MLQKDPSFFKYLDVLLYIFAYGYIYLCPYTKVEESFNMQAMHDHLFIPMDINNYDHQEFPGVVPRTFVGSLVVSILAFPFSFILRHIGYSKFISQYVVRIIISTLFCSSLVRLRKVATKRYGRSIGVYFIVITLCQFHLLFYSSRPLPNVFATIFTTFGFSYWIEEKYRVGIFCFLGANMIFRCDLIILLGPLALSLLIYGKMTLLEGTLCTIKYTLFFICLTVGVDSLFWKHIIYPELEVLYYNTVLNKSSNWGTSPFLWYFYSALPRACSFSLCYLFIGLMASLYNICVAPFTTLSTLWSASSIYNQKKKNQHPITDSIIHLFRFIQSLTMLDASLSMVVVPCLVFIFLYSFLPHKELRFIFPALPIINLCCALGMTKLFRNKSKNILPFLSTFVALCLSLFTTSIFLSASIDNYPGGKAMVALHISFFFFFNIRKYLYYFFFNISLFFYNLKLPNNIPKYVHIDVYSAENGITRFCEVPEWTYSKKENETDYDKYGYLLTHNPEQHKDSFKIIETIQGYIGFDYKHLKPRKGDLIYIMQNTKSNSNFNKT